MKTCKSYRLSLVRTHANRVSHVEERTQIEELFIRTSFAEGINWA